MKTIRVCICDDDRTILAAYGASVRECFKSFGVACEVEAFATASGLKKHMAEAGYDVAFLDIDMKSDTDGITLAEEIRDGDNPIPVIFVSAREDKMYDTFKVRPFGFVGKSNFLNDLSSTVERFLKLYSELFEEPIVLPAADGTYRIDGRKIVYVESFLHNQIVHMGDKSDIEVHSSLEGIFKQLEDKGFIRVHKSYVVNYRYIKKIGSKDVCLTTGEEIPLSRTRRDEAKSLWLEYVSKNGVAET